MIHLQIDAELESLIPPLTEEENWLMETQLCTHGCLQPLIAWKSKSGPILIDGHHRHAICKKHDIHYTVDEMTFKDREEVVRWMILNQLGRRNLTHYQKAMLALRLRTEVGTRKTNDNEILMSCSKIADICGLGRTTIYRAAILERDADPEMKLLLKSGALSISAAYSRLKPDFDEEPPLAEIEVPTRPPYVIPQTRKPMEVTPESIGARGKTQVNGQIVDDPDEIHAMRQAGRIPADQIPVLEVNEPDDPAYDKAIEEATDQEWLESLYARKFLGEIAQAEFDKAATHYRQLADATLVYRAQCRQAINEVGLRQSSLPTWPYRIWSALNIESPEHWTPCPAMDKGGCGGTGEVVGIGRCTKCHGCGFLVS